MVEVSPGQQAKPTDGRETPGLSRDVFVSYASQDAAVANAIVEALEKAGLKCWIAPRDVVPGASYADGIVRAINDAQAFVLVLSGHAVASPHVSRELERAASKRRPIVALRTDTAPLTPAFEYFLSEPQWIDVGSTGLPRAAERLVDAVRRHLDPSAAITPVAQSGAPSLGRAAQTPRPNRMLVGGAAVLALALAYFAVDKFWLSKHVAAATPAAPTAAPVTPATPEKSVAVLPFVDMSEKKDQEYFADGMAEEILDLLTKIPRLTVIGRTSSFAFKGKNEDLRTIGTKLNAAYVLEGSVRNSRDQVRITAQLINTRTGAHEWSETYDRHIGDVLKLQDTIAAAVARELQLTVAAGNLGAHASSSNVEAYDLYLRARHAADRGDPEGLDEAVTLFQQSLDRDPKSANTAAELARAYLMQVLFGAETPAAGVEKARRAAATAIKLEPANVVAHDEMAQIHLRYDWDWAGAERELQQAAALAPGSVDVLSKQARLSCVLGRWDDALAQIKAALIQDPLDSQNLIVLSEIQQARGNLAEAEAAIRRVLDIRPNHGGTHFDLGWVLLARGDRAGALREMQRETIEEDKQLGLALAYYALGQRTEADAALARLLKEYADAGAGTIADVYAFRGESTEAMRWLERAYAQKDPYLYQIKSDGALKGLAGDPRYKAFLRKMNLPE